VKASEIEARIRDWAALRRLEQTHLESWMALAETDRSALLNVAEGLRLRTGQFTAALAMLQEISLRDQQSITGILARNEIRQIMRRADSAPGKGRAFLDELRAIRFPRLKQMTHELAAAIADLSLPLGINVILPHELASDELRIEIVARSGEELEARINAVAQNVRGLRRVIEMLGGVF